MPMSTRPTAIVRPCHASTSPEHAAAPLPLVCALRRRLRGEGLRLESQSCSLWPATIRSILPSYRELSHSRILRSTFRSDQELCVSLCHVYSKDKVVSR